MPSVILEDQLAPFQQPDHSGKIYKIKLQLTISSTQTVHIKDKNRTVVSRSFSQRRFRQNTDHGSTQVARFAVSRNTAKDMCNYNRLLLRFETSNSSKIHTSNLNQNFWHSWGWHFLCTKCPYVESCKLQVGWFRVHTSQRFLKTWHDTTSIASFHVTKFKGCLNATFIQWVFVREDHGTKRSKVHQDKKNHVPRRSNRSPRQSCPTLYNTLLRAPCRLFWLVSNWKRTYHITRQHLLFHKESTLRKTNNQIELFSQYWS